MKHAESDSSEAADDSLTNCPFSYKANKPKRQCEQKENGGLGLTNILSTKEIFKTQQSSVDAYPWHLRII